MPDRPGPRCHHYRLLNEGPRIEALAIRAPLAILGSVLFFALSIRYFGLALTGIPMVLMSTAAARENYRPVEALIFAIAITAFCALLFPILLGQPIPLCPRSESNASWIC